MQTLAQIREILALAGLSPRHAFGQNFLLDHNLLRKLVDASGARAGDVVLEVGPGTGTLTEELLDRGLATLACEIDHGLARVLRERLGPREGFSLVEADCLESKHALSPALREAIDLALARARSSTYRLVANLPYSAATPLISILLADDPRCVALAVTIQREVAQRLLARPGSKDYGPLSVLAQGVARARAIATLPPECFWPRPEVTSAMLLLERLDQPLAPNPRALFDTAQRLFSQRRKQLAGVLARALSRDVALPAGIDPTSRAEQLTVEQFVALSELFPPLPAPDRGR